MMGGGRASDRHAMAVLEMINVLLRAGGLLDPSAPVVCRVMHGCGRARCGSRSLRISGNRKRQRDQNH